VSGVKEIDFTIKAKWERIGTGSGLASCDGNSGLVRIVLEKENISKKKIELGRGTRGTCKGFEKKKRKSRFDLVTPGETFRWKKN